MQAAPSGASQTPQAMFPWQHHMSGPPMPQQMGWGAHGMPGGAMPPHYGGGGPPPYAVLGSGDPLMWWYHDYYGRQAMAAQAGGSAQHMQQGGAAGAMPPPPPVMHGARWWHDPQQTFGPPADPEAVNREAAALAAARRGAGGDSGAVMEVESAPPSKGRISVDKASPAQKQCPSAAGGDKSKGGRLLAPPRRRHRKRKPADPIEEASSGTTGQAHHLGPHAVQEDAQHAPKDGHGTEVGSMPKQKHAPAEANIAKLLLSFSGKAAAGGD